jgi:hypothetical protein
MIESIEQDPNADPFLEPVQWKGKPHVESAFRTGAAGLSADCQETDGLRYNQERASQGREVCDIRRCFR